MKVDLMVLVGARIKFCSRTKKVQHSTLTKFPRQKVQIWKLPPQKNQQYFRLAAARGPCDTRPWAIVCQVDR